MVTERVRQEVIRQLQRVAVPDAESVADDLIDSGMVIMDSRGRGQMYPRTLPRPGEPGYTGRGAVSALEIHEAVPQWVASARREAQGTYRPPSDEEVGAQLAAQGFDINRSF